MNSNGKDKPTLTPEQMAAQIAQQRAMAAAYAAQQRQAMATALLSGILSGLYSNPEVLVEGFGDKALNDAVVFADRLRDRLAQPEAPPAANDPPPAGETATGGTDSQEQPAKIPS